MRRVFPMLSDVAWQQFYQIDTIILIHFLQMRELKLWKAMSLESGRKFMLNVTGTIEGHWEKKTQHLKKSESETVWFPFLWLNSEAKWGRRVFHTQKSSFHSSQCQFEKENDKWCLILKKLILEWVTSLGVWKEMVNRQPFKTVEFSKSWNTGLADLIHDIKAFFGLMRKQMKIIPLQWLFSSFS